MKKIYKALELPVIFILILISFIACDKDFNTIDSDVLGNENANFFSDSSVIKISAYNKKLEALQINNLASNLLGVFNDPEYGKTTASIVTQVTPNSFNENFDVNPVIDSVVFNIPYFNTAISIEDDGTTTYQLDSIYGDLDSKIKLTIYQNKYYLRDFNPSDINTSQNYYSKTENLLDATHNYALNGSQEIDFDNHIGEIIIDTTFTPSANEIVLKTGESDNIVYTRLTPAFRVSFNDLNDDEDEIAFWQQTILDKADDEVLSNSNNFRNYFRGLYFKVQEEDDNGNMFLINLESNDANITIYYTKGEDGSRIQDEYVLNFTGNKLNTFINEFNVPFANGDMDNGDETLYLKGLEGSMAIVDLFGPDLNGDMVPDELDEFLKDYRKTDDITGEYVYDENGDYVLKRLINEAHLTIYEDETKVTNSINEINGEIYHKYDRIYAYDIKNNSTTIDYTVDPFENNVAISSRIFSLGQRDSISPTKAKYKIRLTEHLNNIIQNDSTNYQLGLVLSTNVNYTSNSEVLNSTDNVTAVPSASIISPRGTILYGSNENVNDDRRLKLKIFYTESKEN
ncbi:DUF4270 domain-containing protein [uncultured Algibacter sp.]|uniref:DUF4270 domain-containing protein n=1 Tax=uncultured Algibacter sp. TaxID=298659 RepID=UPI0026079B51|nr:DUF4270 domain-containing protein [uncultured Algibacter sp.]